MTKSEGSSRRVALTVHHLDHEGFCLNEHELYHYTCYPLNGRLTRVRKAYDMSQTGVTMDGEVILGVEPRHRPKSTEEPAQTPVDLNDLTDGQRRALEAIGFELPRPKVTP